MWIMSLIFSDDIATAHHLFASMNQVGTNGRGIIYGKAEATRQLLDRKRNRASANRQTDFSGGFVHDVTLKGGAL